MVELPGLLTDRYSCGIFQLYYETDILPNHSSSSISWIVTVQIFLMFSLGPVVGVLVDVVGPRKLIFPASILALLGVFMISLCSEYWQIMLAQGIAYGIGAAVLFLPPMVCVGQWFSTKRGLATGIVASGSSVGRYPVDIGALICISLTNSRRRGFSYCRFAIDPTARICCSTPLDGAADGMHACHRKHLCFGSVSPSTQISPEISRFESIQKLAVDIVLCRMFLHVVRSRFSLITFNT